RSRRECGSKHSHCRARSAPRANGRPFIRNASQETRRSSKEPPMTEILVLAGALVAIPAGVLVAALCMAGVWTLWERFTETFRVQGEERQWKRLHDRLISDSCWFSED